LRIVALLLCVYSTQQKLGYCSDWQLLSKVIKWEYLSVSV